MKYRAPIGVLYQSPIGVLYRFNLDTVSSYRRYECALMSLRILVGCILVPSWSWITLGFHFKPYLYLNIFFCLDWDYLFIYLFCSMINVIANSDGTDPWFMLFTYDEVVICHAWKQVIDKLKLWINALGLNV